jgi:Ca-activated chloride channel homolog
VSFGSPQLLLFLLAVPAAIAAAVWFDRRRAQRAQAWASPAMLPNLATPPPAWRRWLPLGLLLAGLTLLLVGFARPRANLTVGRNEATVVLVLDVSGSMAAGDVHPSRIAAARAQVRRLLATAPKQYRVALLTFSDHTAVVAPPTRNRALVYAALARARTGPDGTALTEAIRRAIVVGESLPKSGGKRPPATVLVFSDGAQTAGSVTAQQVQAAARQAQVPVSAVVLGTPTGIVRQQVQGGYTEQISVPVEPELLQAVAHSTGGRVYTSRSDLAPVVRDLRSRTGQEKKVVEVTAAAAAGGLAFMVAGGLLSGVWFRRVP